MLVRLGKDRFGSFQINQFKAFPLIAAVLEGSQSGAVFTDKEADPGTIFIVCKSGFSCLYTSDPQPDYPALLDFLAKTPAVPRYIHIYDAAAGFIDYVLASPDKFGCKIRKRIQLQYRMPEIDPQLFYPEMKVTAHEVDFDNIASLASLGLDLESRFWDGIEPFINKGYGTFLTNEQQEPVAICYAAAVAGDLAEVDVLTVPGQQKKGLAKYAASLFIRQGLTRGIRANWDCFEENTASRMTALKLGFTETHRYVLASVYLKSRMNA